ncbi:MAG: calcium-binding protein [Solirubrobacterales bacterium]
MDTLAGSPGGDEVSGGADSDYVKGDEGKDFLSGNGGPDVLRGKAGNDVIVDFRGRNRIFCGGGFDFVLTNRRSEVADNCERRRSYRYEAASQRLPSNITTSPYQPSQ